MLEFTEEAFALIAVFIERFEKPARFFAVGFVGNVRADATLVQGIR